MGYADELFDLTEQVVLITGGSRGLGREMAFGAARCGADVVIASRKMENCVATAEQIERETGRAAMPYQVHVGRWDQLDGLVEATYERFGKVDTLINNAGMSPVYDKLTDVTEKLFDAVVNLNLKGPFRLSALVGERMVAAGRGSIINVSTAGSLRPSARHHPLRGVEGRAQRHDRRAGAGLRTDGAGQYADGRPVPHRRQQVVESGPGDAESIRSTCPCSAPVTRPKSSVLHCFWHPTRPASPPARFCGPTVAFPSGDRKRGEPGAAGRRQ